MSDDDWQDAENMTLAEAWARAQWTFQNGCAYALRARYHYDPEYPSMGFYESAVRRRQWFKIVSANTGIFLNAEVQAKQEMYLTEYPANGDYLNELGNQNSWMTLCDLTVPFGEDKSEKIESGNLDNLPGDGGWQAELRRLTISTEIDLGSLDLKFKNDE